MLADLASNQTSTVRSERRALLLNPRSRAGACSTCAPRSSGRSCGSVRRRAAARSRDRRSSRWCPPGGATPATSRASSTTAHGQPHKLWKRPRARRVGDAVDDRPGEGLRVRDPAAPGRRASRWSPRSCASSASSPGTASPDRPREGADDAQDSRCSRPCWPRSHWRRRWLRRAPGRLREGADGRRKRRSGGHRRRARHQGGDRHAAARRQRRRRHGRRGRRARRHRAVLGRHRRRRLHGHPHAARQGDDDRRPREGAGRR